MPSEISAMSLHEVSAVRVAAAGFDFVHNAQRET